MLDAKAPLVAVPSDVQSFNGAPWHASPQQYLTAALRVAGVVPLIVPALSDDFEVGSVLERVDGVLISGAVSNVHPSRYGVEPSARHEPFDTRRDALTDALMRGALAAGLPLLAICRGIQELNVLHGGTLATEIQELDGRMDHRSPEHPERDTRYAIRQDVLVEGESLKRILGSSNIRVNSLHRQAIDRLGDGLKVEASAPDGTIEAVSVPGARGFALGVQWHPEYFAETDQHSAAIFRAFGDACRVYRNNLAAAAE
ncbi:gamma-glutamyl-gamma-aminobutyrate hydrolase family protein [Aureimonas leprariae]|uniref:gamma-glutamyl-gamma-aminobutyrate hydrolase n=1 Tax=Plantimonas leprariae TaxID=2615207 RepID=A0A7V7PPR0_9HYPH|nr:gamma-glutamyl-gamma-aminobutyrate hydrolase family protein [Aureimonas leprariae]KAB0680017.1 gamma-glutamyl-gamma-aminobutyrate hydrolase family protein [Aureimonas leprariae]